MDKLSELGVRCIPFEESVCLQCIHTLVSRPCLPLFAVGGALGFEVQRGGWESFTEGVRCCGGKE